MYESSLVLKEPIELRGNVVKLKLERDHMKSGSCLKLTINKPSIAVVTPKTNDNRRQSHIMNWFPEEVLSETVNGWQLFLQERIPTKYPETAVSQSHYLFSSHLCIFRIGRRM